MLLFSRTAACLDNRCCLSIMNRLINTGQYWLPLIGWKPSGMFSGKTSLSASSPAYSTIKSSVSIIYKFKVLFKLNVGRAQLRVFIHRIVRRTDDCIYLDLLDQHRLAVSYLFLWQAHIHDLTHGY